VARRGQIWQHARTRQGGQKRVIYTRQECNRCAIRLTPVMQEVEGNLKPKGYLAILTISGHFLYNSLVYISPRTSRSTVSDRQESIALFEYWYSGRVERVPKTAPHSRRFLPPFHRYVPFIYAVSQHRCSWSDVPASAAQGCSPNVPKYTTPM
jgi:hypothetical protein